MDKDCVLRACRTLPPVGRVGITKTAPNDTVRTNNMNSFDCNISQETIKHLMLYTDHFKGYLRLLFVVCCIE